MSGDEVNKSLWIVFAVIILLAALVAIDFTLTQVDFSGIGVPAGAMSGIANGMWQAAPYVASGIVIGLLIFIGSWRRRH